jgi:hypothetical protein
MLPTGLAWQPARQSRQTVARRIPFRRQHSMQNARQRGRLSALIRADGLVLADPLVLPG